MFFACQEEKREYKILKDDLKECPFCGTPGKVYFKELKLLKGEKPAYRIVTGCPNGACNVQPHVVIVHDYDGHIVSTDIQHTIDIWEGRWDGVESLNFGHSNIYEEEGWTFEDIDMKECPWCHEKGRVGWSDYYKVTRDGLIHHSYNVLGGCFNPDCKIGHTIGAWGGHRDDTRDCAIRGVVRRWNNEVHR